jgi:hypothetical protein
MTFRNWKKVVVFVVVIIGLIFINTLAVNASDSRVMVNPILNGGFENGKDGSWTEYSSIGYVDLIIEAGAAGMDVHGGDWLAWMGGMGNYETTLSQSFTIPAGQTILSFWYMVESTDSCEHDYLYVIVNDNQVYSLTLCTDTSVWEYEEVDLQAWEGQPVTVEFSVDLNASVDSNLFLDDVALSAESKNVFLPLLVRGQAQVLITPTVTVSPTVTVTPTSNPNAPRNGVYTITPNGNLHSGAITVADGIVTDFFVWIYPSNNVFCYFSKSNSDGVPIVNNQFNFNKEAGDFTASGTFTSQTAVNGQLHISYSWYITECNLSSFSNTWSWDAAWAHD